MGMAVACGCRGMGRRLEIEIETRASARFKDSFIKQPGDQRTSEPGGKITQRDTLQPNESN